jgi:hypothetical protein
VYAIWILSKFVDQACLYKDVKARRVRRPSRLIDNFVVGILYEVFYLSLNPSLVRLSMNVAKYKADQGSYVTRRQHNYGEVYDIHTPKARRLASKRRGLYK